MTACVINTSYQKLPFDSGDDPDKLYIIRGSYSEPKGNSS